MIPGAGEGPDPTTPRALHILERALVALSVIAILFICVLITATIVTRSLFGWAIPDSEIMVREAMIWATVLPLAYISASRAHIAVDVFYDMMPERMQKRLNLLATLLGFLVLLPIIYGAYLALQRTIARDAYFFGTFEIREWPGRAAFLAGYVLFTLRLGVEVVKDMIALTRRQDRQS